MRKKIQEVLRLVLLHEKPERVISGMALGVDQDWAIEAVKLGIPFTAAVPFEGQESAWPAASQGMYRRLLAKAADVVVVSPGGYSVKAMHARNEWMVNNTDQVVAVWDGSKGGTASTVYYARRIVYKFVHHIDPREIDHVLDWYRAKGLS